MSSLGDSAAATCRPQRRRRSSRRSTSPVEKTNNQTDLTTCNSNSSYEEDGIRRLRLNPICSLQARHHSAPPDATNGIGALSANHITLPFSSPINSMGSVNYQQHNSNHNRHRRLVPHTRLKGRLIRCNKMLSPNQFKLVAAPTGRRSSCYRNFWFALAAILMACLMAAATIRAELIESAATINNQHQVVTSASSAAAVDFFRSRRLDAPDPLPSPEAAPQQHNNNQFANRQGQLLSPQQQANSGAEQQRRPVRQPQQQQQLNQRPNQQQPNQGPPLRQNRQPQQPQQPQSGRSVANQVLNNNQDLSANSNQLDPFRVATNPNVDLQPRFQRLRTPPGGDQFLANQNNNQGPFSPNPGNNNLRQQQQQANQNQVNNLGIPTLSAFDLSSLTNLANQQPSQQQAAANLQQAFRRLQPQQQGNGNQRQQLGNQQQFENLQRQPILSGPQNNNQVPNNNNNNNLQQPNFNGFVPTQGNSLLPPTPQSFGAAPAQTELPFIRQVFRPAPAPLEPVRLPLESELQPPPAEQPAPPQELSLTSHVSGTRPTPPPLFVPARPLVPNKVSRLVEVGGFTGLQSLPTPTQPPVPREVFFEPGQAGPQRQPAQASNQQQRNNRQQPQQRAPQQPQATPVDDQASRRKPPVRRPSQRPQVPQTSVPVLTRLTSDQLPGNQRPDVVRLATNAISTVNEGLAALDFGSNIIGQHPASTNTPELISSTFGSTTTNAAPITTTLGSTASTTAVSTTEPTTVTQPDQPPQSRRTVAPLRSSPFFTLTSASTQTPSSSFSPALPINAAMAASGGRRRIPVRNSANQRGQPTTTMSNLREQSAPTTTPQTLTTFASAGAPLLRLQPTSSSVRRPEIEEFYETIGGASNSAGASTNIDGFGAPARSQPATTSTTSAPTTSSSSASSSEQPNGDLYGSRLTGGEEAPIQPAPVGEQPVAQPGAAPQPAADGPSPSAVMVPVTYMTTLTYLTTVLHGTHTLETSHESVIRSTELATLNAQLMDQIEHKLPLIEPTATIGISSRTKGRGTTIVNLKSAVSAYNQELVEAIGAASGEANAVQPTAVLASSPQSSAAADRDILRNNQQFQQVRPSRTVQLAELQEAKKSLLTEYVYLYTVRPLNELGQVLSASEPTISTRSELVAGNSLDGAQLMGQLEAGAQLIDSNGLLKLPQAAAGGTGGERDGAPLNLGSTVGRDAMTEVKLNVATYVKFDGITNALVDVVKPTVRFPEGNGNELPSGGRGRNPALQLDTSFNVHLTLSNALERLNQPPQQTPSLDSTREPAPAVGANRPAQATRAPEELNRQSVGSQQRPSAAQVSSSNSVRSALRSRVASSRFRSPAPLQSNGPLANNNNSLPPVDATVPTSSPVAPSVTRGRPMKSRLVRPSLQKASSSESAEQVTSSSLASVASAVVQPTRQKKPGVVVVTRSSGFGIRASAASAAAVAAERAASQVEPSSPSSARVVSSRFSNRSRLRSTVSRVPEAITPTPVVAQASSTSSTPSGASSSSGELESSSQQPSSTQATPTLPTSGESAVSSKEETRTSEQPNLPLGVQLDGSSSVVVTYFTTTTHTIPFVMSSQTIFTTLEETNTRIATEHVRDLGSHFIKPTASLGSPMETAAPTTVFATTQASNPPTTQPTSEGSSQSPAGTATTMPVTTTGKDSASEGTTEKPNPSIDPSFVVSLNTRTLFTTFTFFTTYANAGGATPTVVSSESTTSQIVTETISSVYEPAPTKVIELPASTPTAELPSSPVAPAPQPSSVEESQVQPTRTTLVSTMTYYGTVYNGTQTSLTPIVDVSTQVLTLSSPSFNLNSDAIVSDKSAAGIQTTPAAELPARTEVPAPSSTESVPDPSKVTRTRSMYTTLTHYITFYSGTKTQLSTIQEISPTVVTEYIDKTLLEQQASAADAAGQSSVLMVVPDGSASQPKMSLTPSPVLPQLESTMMSSQPDTPAATSTTEQPFSSSDSDMSSVSVSTSSSTTTTTSQPTTTTSAATTPRLELDSVQVNRGQSNQPSESQSVDGRVLPSTDGEGKSAANNIIELSDLIAANSSQSGRLALPGNLGAAIKDIVQLLAGNKTNTLSPLGLPVTPGLSQQDTSEATQGTTQSTTPSSSTAAASTPRQRPPTRVFGNKAKEHLLSLQGSITSPSVPASSIADSSASSVSLPQLSTSQRTPELVVSSQVRQQQQQPAATIFFGDDGGDERKKQVKTIWPGAQSTVYVTSIEPSTRSLTVTTTKVYYTRDAPLTITSSFTTVIPPRTFVSTIMGTRTLVNQLSTDGAGAPPAASAPQDKATTPKPARVTTPSRQESQAIGHRLVGQLAEQRKQAQIDQQQRKLQQQQQQAAAVAAAAAAAKQRAQAAKEAGTNANINQCQPMCKLSNNEICKFTPNSDTVGAQGSFACACRPGYHMVINQVGQKQCVEVQSYVVLLRLLQIGDQQVAFKRELQDRSSPEYRQYSRVIRDHIKRAYMTSELTRDRFVGADVLNYARSLSLQPATTTSSSSAQPTGGRQPISVNTSQLIDPLNAGLIVNITVQLQPPPANTNEILDENTLKEELTKKLNMRQAAALAAAAAAAQTPAGSKSESSSSGDQTDSAASSSDSASANETSSAAMSANATMEPEMLPNPNALFLADVEQVTDLDECANPALNDCHEGAVCINEVGSYKCDCREYPDLNPLHPGRQCANELKSCDFCNNRGDCIRVPSLLPPGGSATNSSSAVLGNRRGQAYLTVCQCHRIYLGRRCEYNGLLLATLLPIAVILLIVSVCLVFVCCRRWRKRTALSKSFRNIGTFGPNMIGGTLDRKAMLESSSESSDTHQRSHHLRSAANGIYDTHGAGLASSDPSSSNESSPRQVVRNQLENANLAYHLSPADSRQGAQSAGGPNPYLGSSIPPQIVIPRARHNQVNYAVHKGQVYMW